MAAQEDAITVDSFDQDRNNLADMSGDNVELEPATADETSLPPLHAGNDKHNKVVIFPASNAKNKESFFGGRKSDAKLLRPQTAMNREAGFFLKKRLIEAKHRQLKSVPIEETDLIQSREATVSPRRPRTADHFSEQEKIQIVKEFKMSQKVSAILQKYSVFGKKFCATTLRRWNYLYDESGGLSIQDGRAFNRPSRSICREMVDELRKLMASDAEAGCDMSPLFVRKRMLQLLNDVHAVNKHVECCAKFTRKMALREVKVWRDEQESKKTGLSIKTLRSMPGRSVRKRTGDGRRRTCKALADLLRIRVERAEKAGVYVDVPYIRQHMQQLLTEFKVSGEHILCCVEPDKFTWKMAYDVKQRWLKEIDERDKEVIKVEQRLKGKRKRNTSGSDVSVTDDSGPATTEAVNRWSASSGKFRRKPAAESTNNASERMMSINQANGRRRPIEQEMLNAQSGASALQNILLSNCRQSSVVYAALPNQSQSTYLNRSSWNIQVDCYQLLYHVSIAADNCMMLLKSQDGFASVGDLPSNLRQSAITMISNAITEMRQAVNAQPEAEITDVSNVLSVHEVRHMPLASLINYLTLLKHSSQTMAQSHLTAQSVARSIGVTHGLDLASIVLRALIGQ